MDQKKMEAKLGKKINLGGRALRDVLPAEEYDLVSFWSMMENRGTNRKAQHRKDHGGLDAQTETAIDQEIELEGQQILGQFNGNARAALDSIN